MKQLSLGFGRCDFTPDVPVSMNSSRTGTEIGDRLYATCLAWQDENGIVLQYSLDLRNIYAPFYEMISNAVAEKTGIPTDRLLLSVTHNHSSPDIALLGRPEIAAWVEKVGLPAACQAGLDAMADLAPVTGAEGGTTITEKLGFVRRYQRADGTWRGIGSPKSDSPIVRAESAADPELRAVRIHREGKKDVVLVNFQAHAASGLGSHPTLVHADFVGPLRRDVEKECDCLMIYLQGACGNVNCNAQLPEDKIGWPGDCFQIGKAMAKDVAEALAEAKPLSLNGMRLVNAPLKCTVNHAKTHLAEKAKEIRNVEDPELKEKMMREAGITSRYEIGAIIKRSAFGEFRDMPLSTLVLGDLAMGFAPVELFDTCGKAFRDASPYAMTFFCGYTNGSHSYMPSAPAFPHFGYEVLECHYVGGTGEMIALKLAAMLNQTKKGLI